MYGDRERGLKCVRISMGKQVTVTRTVQDNFYSSRFAIANESNNRINDAIEASCHSSNG